MRGKELQRTARQPVISSKFFSSAHGNEKENRLFCLMIDDQERKENKRKCGGKLRSNFLFCFSALSYDLINNFVPFLEKQCVQYTAQGQTVYDFKNAEAYLLDLFSGKPLIELEVRMVKFGNIHC